MGVNNGNNKNGGGGGGGGPNGRPCGAVGPPGNVRTQGFNESTPSTPSTPSTQSTPSTRSTQSTRSTYAPTRSSRSGRSTRHAPRSVDPTDAVINHILDLEADGQIHEARAVLQDAAATDPEINDRFADTHRVIGLLQNADQTRSPDLCARIIEQVEAQRPYLPRPSRRHIGGLRMLLASSAFAVVAVAALLQMTVKFGGSREGDGASQSTAASTPSRAPAVTPSSTAGLPGAVATTIGEGIQELKAKVVDACTPSSTAAPNRLTFGNADRYDHFSWHLTPLTKTQCDVSRFSSEAPGACCTTADSIAAGRALPLFDGRSFASRSPILSLLLPVSDTSILRDSPLSTRFDDPSAARFDGVMTDWRSLMDASDDQFLIRPSDSLRKPVDQKK